MSTRFVLPHQAIYTSTGAPMSGALAYFYETGTSTPKDTYSDSALTTANTNPVVADASGRFSDIFLSGTYKVVIKNSAGVQIYEAYPIAPHDASSLTYTPAGTGAVATTVQAELRKTIWVDAPTGGDDTAMIQARITSAETLRDGYTSTEIQYVGVTVQLAPGIYKVTQVTLPDSGISLAGSGMFSTKIEGTSATGHIVIVGDSSTDATYGVHVRDLHIGAEAGLNRTSGSNLYVANVRNCYFNNLMFSDYWNGFVLIQRSTFPRAFLARERSGPTDTSRVNRVQYQHLA